MAKDKNILKFLNRLLGWSRTTAEEREQDRFIATALKDSRKHSRFSLCYKNAAFLITGRGDTLHIANVSFEGLGIYFEKSQHDQLVHSGHVGFHFLGQNTEVFVQQAYVGESVSGYRLVHENSASLIFVREIIDALKKGSSLQLIKKEMLQENLRGDEWTCLHGEGPTDLRIKTGPDGVPNYCILTFRIGDEYFELLYDGQTLHLEPGGRVAAMMLTAVRYGLTILLGVQDAKVAQLLRPVFVSGLKTLTTMNADTPASK